MARLASALALVVVSALTLAAVGAGTTYRGIQETTMAGGVRCTDLQGLHATQSVRFVAPVNGATSDGIHLFVNGTLLEWYVDAPTIGVEAVIVKGGKNSNVYRYPYPAEHFSDAGLSAPEKVKNGKLPDLGYVECCYSVS